MMANSLRLRLVAGGVVTIVIALVIAGAALTYLFERHVLRTVAADLEVYLNQLLAGIDVTADNRIVVNRPPADPRFADPLSGLYWQINDGHGLLLRSRSLWDSALPAAPDTPAGAPVRYRQANGPAGARVLVAEQSVTVTVTGRPETLRIAVATDLSRVVAARTAFATDLAIALGILGLVLAAATAVQVSIGLHPLDALRRSVADIRSGGAKHLSVAMPREVKPLVDEMNALLDARETDIARSRNRAADLAHGLKTPLAALTADGNRLRQRGETAIAKEIETAVEAMRRHVDRELARARLRGAHPGPDLACPVAPLANSLIATLSRTELGSRIDYDIAVAQDVILPFDRTDLAEVLGNLLENATRHAKTHVCIGASGSPTALSVSIEDDGPGIAEEMRAAALTRGGRLDERAEGTGLGLAIVQDVLEAYGWTLVLSRSVLGGLKATCTENVNGGGATAAERS
jgi:signal transduction histidine kinase